MLRYFSRSDFDFAVSGYNADFRQRTLSRFDLFKAMLYGQVSGCFSVKEIEASMKANGNRLYHTGLKQPMDKVTFEDKKLLGEPVRIPPIKGLFRMPAYQSIRKR